MSERTEQNKKSELAMVLVILVVALALAAPIALSVFRNSVPFVAVLLQAAPFVLISTAIASMVYVAKKDK